MDKKSVIVLVVCIIILFLWYPVVVNKWIAPPRPVPVGMTNATPQLAARTNAPVLESAYLPPVAPVQALPPVALDTNVPEETVELRTSDARYTFSSYGGGIQAVELLKYPEKVSKRRADKSITNGVATLNAHVRVPALAILGGPALEGDGIFKIARTSTGVRAEKTLTNGLVLVKEFTPGSNYLLSVRVQIENQSDSPLSLPAQEWITGTATPLNDRDDGSTVGVMWYNGKDAKSVTAGWFANKTLGCFPGTPRPVHVDGQSNVFWTAVFNQFFAMAVMVKDPAQQIVIRKLNLPPPTAEDLRIDSRLTKAPEGFETAMLFPAAVLAPDAVIERQFTIFTGPKEYRTLATIAAGAGNNVDAVMGFGGFFGFFSKGLLLAMNWLHSALSLSYGWAIIAITVIIKILFWPLTRASTRSMKRMQALQPQMKAIKDKYKDDAAKMNRKTMEFMKEHKVSPLGGCLPMVLQMPVFIGFFYMIRSAIELRGASFLWVGDLSSPDTLFMIPGTTFPFNLLPLIMGVTMLWQAHLTPPSPGMDPMQAKMMKYMPLMFMVFLYNFSAGLTLYWTVQNLLTIAQTKLTKDVPATTTPAPQAPVAPVRPRKRK